MLQIIGFAASLIKLIKEPRTEVATEEVKILYIDGSSTEITDLILYPWRGIQGIHVNSIKLTNTGFEYDRYWFCIERTEDQKLINEPGRLWQGVSKSKELGRISARFEDRKFLIFSHPDMQDDLKIDMTSDKTEKEVFDFYNYESNLLKWYSEGKEAEEWFTKACGKPLVLVRSWENPPIAVHNVEHRMTEKYKEYKRNPGHTDAPIHFITERSLEDLRARVNNPEVEITPAQFKPNIVLAGKVAYEEDNMREMIIETKQAKNIRLAIFKHCLRWKITSYNYAKGDFDENMEPFTTLRKYRSYGAVGIAFGMYAAIDSDESTDGVEIHVGDKVTYTKCTSRPIKFN